MYRGNGKDAITQRLHDWVVTLPQRQAGSQVEACRCRNPTSVGCLAPFKGFAGFLLTEVSPQKRFRNPGLWSLAE